MKKKRWFTMIGSICLSLVLAALLLPACAPVEVPEEIAKLEAEIADLEDDVAAEKTKTAAEKAKVSNLEAEIAALKKPVEVLEWNFQHTWAAGENHFFYRLRDIVGELSDGRLQLEVFSSNELVPDMDAAEAVSTRVLDMSMIHLDQYSGTVPEGAIEQIPFLWKDLEEKATAYFEWGITDILAEATEDVYDGLKIVGWTIADPGCIIFKDEFETLADLKGKIINVDDPMASILRDNFGLSITFFPPEEIYTALATGTLDGTEYGSEVAMTAMGLEEVGKYLMLPHYQIFWCGCYIIPEEVYNTMPDDLRAILVEGLIAMGWHMRTTYNDMMFESREKMLKAGVTFVVLPDEDIAALSAAGLDAMADIKATSPRCERLVNLIEESLAKFGR